jgi:phospholipase C
VPTAGYFFRDIPFLGIWGLKYYPFWHPYLPSDREVILAAIGVPVNTPSFVDVVEAGSLPNVSFVDPAFNAEGAGMSGDDHPLSDIRIGERFIADVYHALADAGYLDRTVLVVTFDEWGGFFDHVPPPQVIDDTDPSTVDHTGNSSIPTDGQLVPNYGQLGFRVPAIVVSNLAPARVIHHGPFEHTSTLAFIESTFGLQPLTARDTNAENLGQVLLRRPRRPVPPGTIPTSSDVPGPADPKLAVCSVRSVQSISPPPVLHGRAATR